MFRDFFASAGDGPARVLAKFRSRSARAMRLARPLPFGPSEARCGRSGPIVESASARSGRTVEYTRKGRTPHVIVRPSAFYAVLELDLGRQAGDGRPRRVLGLGMGHRHRQNLAVQSNPPRRRPIRTIVLVRAVA